jgi:hypothetical protein
VHLRRVQLKFCPSLPSVKRRKVKDQSESTEIDLQDSSALSHADLRFADLRGCSLRKAKFVGADLRWAILEGANLAETNLTRARLKGAVLHDITVNWTDRTLVSEILWQAAGENANRLMVAALIGRQADWCWDKFLAIASPERLWAVQELRAWIKEGDGAPDLLLARETEAAD